MIKQTQSVPLSYIRGNLVRNGFQIERIRTKYLPTPEDNATGVEVELKPQRSPSSDDWSPADLRHWVQDCFAEEASVVKVEYRGGTWFASLRCYSDDEIARRAGQLTLDGGALGDQDAPGSVGSGEVGLLDNIPF